MAKTLTTNFNSLNIYLFRQIKMIVNMEAFHRFVSDDLSKPWLVLSFIISYKLQKHKHQSLWIFASLYLNWSLCGWHTQGHVTCFGLMAWGFVQPLPVNSAYWATETLMYRVLKIKVLILAVCPHQLWYEGKISHYEEKNWSVYCDHSAHYYFWILSGIINIMNFLGMSAEQRHWRKRRKHWCGCTFAQVRKTRRNLSWKERVGGDYTRTATVKLKCREKQSMTIIAMLQMAVTRLSLKNNSVLEISFFKWYLFCDKLLFTRRSLWANQQCF